jgi:hypothetical protein
VTLRQLMGHLAGVRNDGGDESPLFSAHCERPVGGIVVAVMSNISYADTAGVALKLAQAFAEQGKSPPR